ncbi:DUF885 domain-containing protein [Botrimarina hoheduenensis]|uniref:DUF885 domain-containing protein n=1 Tax=Botrimarina hoheduenensis TaxID=2528000 RepID=A0A5C5VV48_9BACT|nr:DUF885 domain-containing protein [Botrimarina hoheduenensis]TWT42474.1 hypothetical protein Pla111_27790 [Botrimarina hoheduenensis]
MHRPIFLFLLATLVALVPYVSQAATPDEQVAVLLDEVWQYRLQEYPESATRSGVHVANDRLTSISLADSARRAAQSEAFLTRLRAIDPEALGSAARLERDLLLRELSNNLAEHSFRQELLPIDGRSGFHIEFPELPDWVPLRTVKDYENYVARLRAFPAQARGYVELMREGVRAGITPPAVILEGFEESITAHLVSSPQTSLLYKPFKNFPATISPADQERLTEAGRKAIAEAILPTYEFFLRFMTDEYVPACRTSVGALALPGGRDFYRFRVRKFTTLDTTPEEVHQRGLAEVQRIRSEMARVIERVGFDGDFAAFVQHLRTEPRFYAESDEQLLAACAAILKRADGELPTLFGALPRMPYGLKPVPAYIAPKTTAAYYMRPNGDGTKAGFFFLNTYDLRSRPLYMLEALALHEAVPGHHLQIALQQELEGLSPLRQNGGFTAFVEGWGLYAERLGLEMGFYEDPYSDFGRLSMEIWRACRLVVDTGLHYNGWTRDEAIAFMTENSALSLHNIRAEVDRYIGWPGQALAYKTGELKIRELRGLAEQRLGERFDVREFHDVVLRNGAVPLDVLERLVNEWLEEQRVAHEAPAADSPIVR